MGGIDHRRIQVRPGLECSQDSRDAHQIVMRVSDPQSDNLDEAVVRRYCCDKHRDAPAKIMWRCERYRAVDTDVAVAQRSDVVWMIGRAVKFDADKHYRLRQDARHVR